MRNVNNADIRYFIKILVFIGRNQGYQDGAKNIVQTEWLGNVPSVLNEEKSVTHNRPIGAKEENMFFVVLLIIIAIVVVGFMLLDRGHEGSGLFFTVFPIIFFMFGIICWVITYPASVSENGELLAAKVNLEALRITSIKLNSIATISKGEGELIDAANLQQSTNASNAILNYTNKLIQYNTNIEKRKQYKRLWFTSLFYASLPPDIDKIELKL